MNLNAILIHQDQQNVFLNCLIIIPFRVSGAV